jgi:hypothetical protein
MPAPGHAWYSAAGPRRRLDADSHLPWIKTPASNNLSISCVNQWLQCTDFSSILPKHIIEWNSFSGKSTKSCFKLLIKQAGLFDPACVYFRLQGVHLEDVILIDTILRAFLSYFKSYDIVKNEAHLVASIGYYFPLQKTVISLKNKLQLTFLLPLERLEHVLRTINDENCWILLRCLEIGSIVTETQIVEHLFDVFALALIILLLVELHPSKNITSEGKFDWA